MYLLNIYFFLKKLPLYNSCVLWKTQHGYFIEYTIYIYYIYIHLYKLRLNFLSSLKRRTSLCEPSQHWGVVFVSFAVACAGYRFIRCRLCSVFCWLFICVDHSTQCRCRSAAAEFINTKTAANVRLHIAVQLSASVLYRLYGPTPLSEYRRRNYAVRTVRLLYCTKLIYILNSNAGHSLHNFFQPCEI